MAHKAGCQPSPSGKTARLFLGFSLVTILLSSAAQGQSPSAGIGGGGEPGKWSSISGPRVFYHSATLLKSGKVLVAGGCAALRDNSCVSATDKAWIFNPATSKWTVTAKMTARRAAAPSVLLPDGKVMVEGGCAETSPALCLKPLGTAEVFDPRTSRWTELPKSALRLGSVNLGDSSANLLPLAGSGCGAQCGKVLITSSAGPGQVYDPAANSWSALAAKPGDRLPQNQTTTVLSDGRVLVHGVVWSQVFEPAADRWIKAPGAPINRTLHTASALADGSVLMAGGFGVFQDPAAAPLSSSEIFVPSSQGPPPAPSDIQAIVAGLAPGAWKPEPTMNAPRFDHTAVTLKDGRVLLMGGSDKVGKGLATTEIYDPQERKWTVGPSMIHSRGGQTKGPATAFGDSSLSFVTTPASFTSTALKDGRVLVVGGGSGAFADVYTPGGIKPGPAGAGRKPVLAVVAVAGLAVALLAGGCVLAVRSRKKKS